MSDTRKDLGLTYEQALHGIQTAIQHEISTGKSRKTEPKHMRVGIDSGHISDAALVTLLIQKGLIDETEFHESLRRQANAELADYEATHAPLQFR